MAQTQQPADIWPWWLHLGCLGCSGAAAAAMVAAAVAGVVVIARQSAGGTAEALAGRQPPIVQLDSGAVGVVRATGYSFEFAQYTDDGRIVAGGSRQYGFAELLAEAMRTAAAPQGSEEVATDFGGAWVVLIQPRAWQVSAMRAPRREGETALAVAWQADATGRWLAVCERVFSGDEDEPRREILRLVDLSKPAFVTAWRAPEGTKCRPIGWLEDGSGVVCVLATPSGQARKAGDRLAVVRRDGTVLPLARLPENWRTAWVVGRQVIVLAMGRSAAWGQVVSIDVNTGGMRAKRIAVAPGVVPGRLEGDEIFLALAGRAAAFSPTARRLRWLTWPGDKASVLNGVVCGDGRWAVVRIIAGRMTGVAALDMSAGRFHQLAVADGADEFYSVLAGHRRQLRVLVARSNLDVFSFAGRRGSLLDVYLDEATLEAQAGTTKVDDVLKPGRPRRPVQALKR